MKKLSFIFLLLTVLFVGCKPERPKDYHGSPRIFYPQTAKQDSIVVPDSIVEQALAGEVVSRTLSIFQIVLGQYNLHQYNSIDAKALPFCTVSLRRKYNSIMQEWKQLSAAEQAEYVEGPSLWWYFIGGNIDTRYGKKLVVRASDIEVITVDDDIAMLRVSEKVSDLESTYCKVVLRNVNNTWLIDDLIPEAIGGGGDNRSFMNDHW